MKKNIFCISLFLLIALTSFAQGGGNVVLKKGQKFMQETSGNVLITQNMMGQSMESKIDMKVANTIEVKDVKDTSYSLSNTIIKMKMDMSAMGQDMNYDSEKQDNDSSISKGMNKVLNHPKNLDVSKTGKLISSTEDDSTSESGADIMAGLQYMLGNSDAFLLIPKAKVGYSWSDSTNRDGTKSNTIYTIKELNGNDATVTLKGNVQSSQKTETQNMEVTNNSTGTFSGDMVIDIKTGIVKQRNTTIETTGTVEVMGQQIPMSTKVTSQTTIKSM